jgi:hypothetical protein
VTRVRCSAIGFVAVLVLAPRAFGFQSAAFQNASFQSAAGMQAAEIVKRSVAANTADWNAQPQFSHRERDAKNGGQSKSYEVSMIEGSPYSRLVEIDNQPLSREQQQAEQAKLNREIARRQNESQSDRQARLAKYRSDRAEEHVLMQQMTQAFRFRTAGEQVIDGVACYVLDAEPNPAYQPAVEKARVLLGMKGRLWIEKEHYHWVKVEAEVIHPVEIGLFVAKVRPGTRFELEQAPLGDVWLPKHFSAHVNASVFGLYGIRSSEEELYSDYRSIAAAGLLSAKAKELGAANAASGGAHAAHPAGASEIAAR